MKATTAVAMRIILQMLFIVALVFIIAYKCFSL